MVIYLPVIGNATIFPILLKKSLLPFWIRYCQNEYLVIDQIDLFIPNTFKKITTG